MPANPTAPAVRPLAWRTGFDAIAEEYDAVRPGYPAELIAEVVSQAALPTPARILEIGVGTGQATLPFARRGDSITGLDIGASLLAIARQKLALFPQVQLLQTAFEDWEPENRQFDAVLAASAFHWIEPNVGLPKIASLMVPAGGLILLGNEHHAFSPGFAENLYRINKEFVPDWTDPRLAPDPATTEYPVVRAITTSGLFGPVRTLRREWEASHDTGTFLRLLNTYSNYRHLAPRTRERLFQAIGAVIDNKYTGVITKSYVAVAHIALRHSESVGQTPDGVHGDAC